MEKIKKVIKLDLNDVYVNLQLTQTIYNIGTFTDVPFLFNEVSLKSDMGNRFIREPHMGLYNFINNSNEKVNITAFGSSELNYFHRYGQVDSYADRFVKNTFLFTDIFKRYPNDATVMDVFVRRSVIEELSTNTESGEYGEYENPYETYIATEPLVQYLYEYCIGVDNENDEFPLNGLRYSEIMDDYDRENPIVRYKSQGYNYTNTSYFANIKEEHLIGISDKLETESNINIDRINGINVFEIMQKLGEINNVDHLSHYGNGEFNIIK